MACLGRTERDSGSRSCGGGGWKHWFKVIPRRRLQIKRASLFAEQRREFRLLKLVQAAACRGRDAEPIQAAEVSCDEILPSMNRFCIWPLQAALAPALAGGRPHGTARKKLCVLYLLQPARRADWQLAAERGAEARPGAPHSSPCMRSLRLPSCSGCCKSCQHCSRRHSQLLSRSVHGPLGPAWRDSGCGAGRGCAGSTGGRVIACLPRRTVCLPRVLALTVWRRPAAPRSGPAQYRWHVFKSIRGAIDQNEGGLDKFTQGAPGWRAAVEVWVRRWVRKKGQPRA